MRNLNVYIRGIDPANKGACLMLAAIQDQLAARFDAPRVAVGIAVPVEHRLRQGVWAVTPANWSTGLGPGRLKSAAVKLMRGQSHKLGLLHEAEIDVVLDASGFAYGDFWKKAKFDGLLGDHVPRWKAQGKTVIAMPQAWGGFSEPGFAQAVRDGLSHLDLVFARDPQSLAYLEETGFGDAVLAPDFTNLLAPTLPRKYADLAGAGFIIPNGKIIEAKGEAARTAYLEFLCRAVAALEPVCPAVHILNHEGKKDQALAQALNDLLPRPLRIIDPAAAVDVKAILGNASALVSSRFHGLVSALSGGVPSVACGWSHKYDALLSDYGTPQYSLKLDTPDHWDAQLAAFTTDLASAPFRAALATEAATQKDKARAAWDQIEQVIRARTDHQDTAA